MKTLKKPLLAFLVMLLATSVQAEGIKFQHLTLAQGIEKAKNENKQLFIDIYATWCGPCKYLSSSVFTDNDLGVFMNKNFVCLKLDGEEDDGMSLMMDYNLDSYPTMLFLSPEKVVLKKLVGVVSADEINNAGTGVLNPESTDLFKLQKRYKEGEREKEFMHELIEIMLLENLDTKEVIDEFVSIFPDLELENENDFLIFCIAINDLEDNDMVKFIAEAGKFKELYGDLVDTKITMILSGFVQFAIEKGEVQIIYDGVDKVFEAYSDIFGEDSYPKDELTELLLESYFEETQ